MALKTRESNLNTMFLRVKSTENEYPYFEVTKKEEDKWVVTDLKPTTVEGTIRKFTVKQDEYKGQEYQKLMFSIRDGGDNYVLDVRLRKVGRALLNSLFALTQEQLSHPVSITVYRNKAGKDGVVVSQNGENVSWKYSVEDLPRIEEIKNAKGAVVSYDTTELDEFFLTKSEEHFKFLAEASGSPEPAVTVKSPAKDDDDEDDKPF